MSDGNTQTTSAGNAGFDRTAGAQRWGEGGPERAKSRSLGPLLKLAPYMKRQRTTGIVTMSAVVTNQRGEKILDGEHVYLLKL